MAGARHRQKFGESFDHPERQRFDENDKVHGPDCKRWRRSTAATDAKKCILRPPRIPALAGAQAAARSRAVFAGARRVHALE
jgi:hypothetical protein